MGDLAVRTKVIRGHLTTEEKRQFDKLVDSFGMYQQDVLSNILVWWLKQGSKLQAAIGQSEGDMVLASWARSASDKRVMALLEDLLKVKESENYSDVKWTGYRITGTVNRSNGYLVRQAKG